MRKIIFPVSTIFFFIAVSLLYQNYSQHQCWKYFSYEVQDLAPIWCGLLVPRNWSSFCLPLTPLLPEMSISSCSLLPVCGVLSGVCLGTAEPWDQAALWVASPLSASLPSFSGVERKRAPPQRLCCFLPESESRDAEKGHGLPKYRQRAGEICPVISSPSKTARGPRAIALAPPLTGVWAPDHQSCSDSQPLYRGAGLHGDRPAPPDPSHPSRLGLRGTSGFSGQHPSVILEIMANLLN